MLSYDTCLLIIEADSKNLGIAKFQTDNTLNVETKAFINKKETEITKAKFKAKLQTIWDIGISRNFNGCRMTIIAESIMVG